MLEGHAIYCPIAESHSIQRLHVDAMSGGWDFWKGQDLPKLDRCDELWVVQLDGWDTSTGVKGEVEYMREQGKPIKFINPNTYLNRGD